MQAMKGATMALGSMNKSMNLPQLQRIAMEFERENDIMEQRQEMMDDAVDDAMDVGVEEEGDEVVEQVLEEIGIDLNQAVRLTFSLVRDLTQKSVADCWKNSSERPQPPWAIPLCLRARLRKLLALEAEAEAVTQSTTTSKLDSTVFESEEFHDPFTNKITKERGLLIESSLKGTCQAKQDVSRECLLLRNYIPV